MSSHTNSEGLAPRVTAALGEFERSRKKYMSDLCELVRIPSISFPGFPASEVRRSAEATAKLLSARGFDNVRLIDFRGCHPYVYGERMNAPGKPTLLLYAHHDVQPVGEASAWQSEPFEPVLRDGRLFG